MKISVADFVQTFKDKKIENTRIAPDAIEQYIRQNLEIKTYIPFRTKREIAETVVAANTTEVDGIKKNDGINQYISFIVAMISVHTNLEFDTSDSVADYDLLAETGLLPLIIEEFRASYNECDIILKMALAAELEDNNVNVLVGKFLNGILTRLDGVGESLKNVLGDINLGEVLGGNFSEEDMAKLSSFLDKYNK
jgi:hypothetical protein